MIVSLKAELKDTDTTIVSLSSTIASLSGKNKELESKNEELMSKFFEMSKLISTFEAAKAEMDAALQSERDHHLEVRNLMTESLEKDVKIRVLMGELLEMEAMQLEIGEKDAKIATLINEKNTILDERLAQEKDMTEVWAISMRRIARANGLTSA